MIQLDESKMAEWWCNLNASIWPDDFPPMLGTSSDHAQQCSGAWRVVNMIASAEGQALWAKRHRARLDPATGKRRKEAAPC